MNSNWALDPLEAQRRTNLANKRSNELKEANSEWVNHATNLEKNNAILVEKLNYSAALVERYQDLANTAGNKLIALSKGNTIIGFTNAPGQELEVLTATLLEISHLVGDPHEYWIHRAKAISDLTEKQMKEINLKLLCRMEWIDWCLQVDVLAKFGTAVTEAFLNGDNKQIRNRELLSYFTKESKQYHVLRDKAMDPKHGDLVRIEFEKTRFNFWKNRIKYKHWDDGSVCPNTDLTLHASPDISLDSHLIGGQIAEKFGINIRTLKKDVCFNTQLAHIIPDGLDGKNLSSHYI